MPAHRLVVTGVVGVVGVVGVLAGCEPTAPANPSWQTDVMPILAASCVRCHAPPQIGGAPPEFRLDSFAGTQVGVLEDGSPATLQGAATYATTIARRIVSDGNPMPPRFPLEPWQIDTLTAWAAQDPIVRGAPRPDNRLPTLVVHEIGRDSNVVVLAYDLHDPDGDLVVGELCDDDGGACAFVAPLQSGHGELRIDTTRFALPIALRARLDDGAGMIDQAARTVGAP